MRHLSIAVFLVVPAFSSPAVGDVLFVDSTAVGADNGTSWCDAFLHLQDALLAPMPDGESVREIRVAAGKHRPDQGGGQVPGDSFASFQLYDGLTLRGGFAGCGGTDPDRRDPKLFPTLLDGDLADDDEGNFQNYKENSLNVLRTEGTSSIDGFEIQRGNGVGGGLRASGTLQVSNCVFRHNLGTHGGAMLANGDVTVTDSQFIANKADIGGAVLVADALTVERCVFVNNSAGYGGAINLPEGRLTATQTIFANNTASFGGGAIYAGRDVPRISLQRCIVVGNESDFGGAFRLFEAEIQLFNSLVAGNVANLGGGLLLDECIGDNRIVHTTIVNNTAQAGGGLYGAACLYPDRYAVWNSIFRANGADHGSQILLDACDVPGPTDTFRIAFSSVDGGLAAIPVADHWALQWEDSNGSDDPLFLAAPVGQGLQAPVYDPSLGQSILKTNSTAWVPRSLEGKLIQPDPDHSRLFLIAGNDRSSISVWGDASAMSIAGRPFSLWNFRTSNLSPCVDAGSVDFSSGDTDLDGRKRALGDSPDIGAFEFGDCDINDTLDVDDLLGGAADCDDNGILDACDLLSGLVGDCSLNGIPDACEGNSACDEDGDGVSDDEDHCPDSVMTQTVELGDCQTSIANEPAHKGCTMMDQLLDCDAKGKSRGQFIRCVSALSRDWQADDLITRRERARIIACAARP